MEYAGELADKREIAERLVRTSDGVDLRIRLPLSNKPVLKRKEFMIFIALSWIFTLCYLYPYLNGLPGSGFVFCIFRRVTGIPCLFCGMTRSMAATAHLRLNDAFYYHLLGPFIFFTMVIFLLAFAFLFLAGRSLELYISTRLKRWFGWSLLILFIAAWVGKMVFFGANV